MPIVKLKCNDCPSFSCGICPIGKWVDNESLRGCSRKLTEDEYIEYLHIKEEVIPFVKSRQNFKVFDSVDRIDKLLLSKPLVHEFDDRGKVVETRRRN